MTDRWHQLERLFEAALKLPPSGRRDFLDRACGGDTVLRDEVLGLLAVDSQAGAERSIRDALSSVAKSAVRRRPMPAIGRAVGPYHLFRELGSGGMGTVFLAAREDDRNETPVALKVIRRQRLTRELLRRFEREREILARLADPGIARLVDGGTTADGISYLVMEYVDGHPIDEYCEDHRLSLDERLSLFRQVCVAVQHAHDAQVIHRDLKPSNILVTRAGSPKLVDFGIAKQLEDGVSLVGETSALASRMTPAYASPEQMLSHPLTVSTDVYSLGVVLYELITLALPYNLEGELLARQRAIIATADPHPPSVVASRAKLPWAGEISGELDFVVMRALQKEPILRYPSVLALARDLDFWRLRST
jgi:serine/threonine protein kinase